MSNIEEYTKNFKFMIPEFNVATWHDEIKENFKAIDAILANFIQAQQYKGAWKKVTQYYVDDLVYISDEDSNNYGGLFRVLVDHITTGDDFDTFLASHPTYYDLQGEMGAQIAAQRAQDWANKTNGKVIVNEVPIDYSSKAYAIGGDGTETNNSKYFKEQSELACNTILNDAGFIAIKNDFLGDQTIKTVANNIQHVQNIDTYILNVINVSTNIANVNTCATNINAIQDAPNQAQAAATSAELSAQYANDKINQTHITNCITEIPQNINLILSSGTLTLKSGSILIAPDGNQTTTSEDKTYTASGSSSYIGLLFVGKADGSIQGIYDVSKCGSGSSLPADGSTYTRFLNTTDNKIYRWSSGTWSAWAVAFPLAICTVTSGTITSIDQVFNGFGFIGSTVFALPGVKGLIPNGRNPDGTLKNKSFVVNSVLKNTLSNDNANTIVLSATTISCQKFPTTWKYDEEKNMIINVLTNEQRSYCVVGQIESVNSGTITSLKPSKILHVVDYDYIDNYSVIATGTTLPRLVKDRFADVLNVKDFGAKGDGSTNDTSAIQAALNRASSTKTPLFMPSGTYMIRNTLYINSNTTIIGVKNQTEIKLQAGYLNHHIMMHENTTDTETTDNVYIENIIFNGNADTSLEGYGKAGFLLYGCKNVTIIGCVFKNNTFYGLALQAHSRATLWHGEQKNVIIRDCEFYNNGHSGLEDTGDSIDIKYVENCIIDGCYIDDSADTGIDVRGIDISIKNCVVKNSSTGIHTHWGEYDALINVSGCSVYGGNYGIVLQEIPNTENKVGNISITNCSTEGAKNGIMLDTFTGLCNFNVSGCLCDDIDYGIRINCSDNSITSAKSLIVTNCIVKDTTKGIASNLPAIITNNEVTNCGYNIEVSDSIITNCKLHGATTYAINGTGNNVSLCSFDNNVSVISSSSNNIGLGCSFNNNTTSPAGITVDYGSGGSGAVLVPCGPEENIVLRLSGKGNQGVRTYADSVEVVRFAKNIVYPATTNVVTLGNSSHLYKEIFCANATINTSDERQKQEIKDIDERVLTAWGKVKFKQFLFNNAVKLKGKENARIHIGLIAQQVKEAFESEGLDAFKYGLLCYDEWDDEYEDNQLITKAGNAYGIRYGEALALECAYQRWITEKLTKRVEVLENVGE